MTVAELIAALSEFPADAEVGVSDDGMFREPWPSATEVDDNGFRHPNKPKRPVVSL